MISDDILVVREAEGAELSRFQAMESHPEAIPFVHQYSLERHHLDFEKESVRYLTISDHSGAVLGYFILRLEEDGQTVEFARIVVAQKNRGTGRRAIPLMERYCHEILGRTRIWLDVYDFNDRGRHLYQSLGYRFVKTVESEGKSLLVFEKSLSEADGC